MCLVKGAIKEYLTEHEKMSDRRAYWLPYQCAIYLVLSNLICFLQPLLYFKKSI